MKKLVISTLLASSVLLASNGEELVTQNGCMECHQMQGQAIGPAFMGIAKKNKTQFSDIANEKIFKSIKNGSSGQYRKFKDTPMPAFSNLNDTDIQTITSWILSLDTSSMRNGSGGNKGNRY